VNKEKLSSFCDQACAVSLCLLMFFIPISATPIEFFWGISLFFFLGRLLTCGGLFIQLLKREKTVLFFFVALVFSLINSGAFISISLHALFFDWGEYIILYLMITQVLNSASRIKSALVLFSLGAITVILDCFCQLFLNLEFIRHRHMILHAHHILAVSGPFRHNNDFAAYLICALIIILYWIFSKGPQAIKVMAVIVYFLGVFILAHAYSRGGSISFVFAIILLSILLKKFWFLCFSVLTTIILCFKFVVFKFLTFGDSGRFELWAIAWRMIKAHPLLGNGIGTFMAWFRSFSPTGGISYAHNCFLQLWAEAGLVSMAIFCFFIFETLNTGILTYKENKDPVFLILPCAVIAFLCSSFVDTFFFSYPLASLFWVMMGLLKAEFLRTNRRGD
jgi:hypothetical protein